MLKANLKDLHRSLNSLKLVSGIDCYLSASLVLTGPLNVVAFLQAFSLTNVFMGLVNAGLPTVSSRCWNNSGCRMRENLLFPPSWVVKVIKCGTENRSTTTQNPAALTKIDSIREKKITFLTQFVLQGGKKNILGEMLWLSAVKGNAIILNNW